MITLDRIEGKLDALREDMDKLLQSHAALDAKVKEHDEWAKSTHVEANKQLAENKIEHEAKQREWKEASQSIAGLLVGIHERIDKLAKPKRKKVRR